ncbi:DUF262 domain-containing protein [uncultured Brachyspira sp.]|uniref:DUF262 domain-containing protein n=1 Tax=uncultured Brachyspira sp. TaxID=221953 RepID=UPI002592D244|nr:DUF262 domain-containing protein [uncultured Brachyspira sp.]
MNEKLSLIGFFSKKYSRIEIPKIQRDYAQGRENENEVADRFLNKIFECLKEDDKKLELDFIYGSVINKTVYLLDGQQRVTTLFLLHWYIALREDRFDEIKCLEKFTYSTRVSSREFCKNIIDNIKNIKEYYNDKYLDESEEDDEVKLSDIITNFYWFTNENDPTIKAMLNMINKIDEKYNEIMEDNNSIKLFDNLKKIQFYFLPLNNFNLTDEIYLKMNARGKPLTSFENFKADLTDYILKINGNEINNLIQQQLSDLDNKYTNFFWKLSKKYNEKNKQNNILLDDLYIKFFYRITLIYFIINYKESNEKLIKDKSYQYLKVNSNAKLEGKNKYSSFKYFEETYNKNLIKNIFDTLNLLDSKYLLEMQSNITPLWDNKYDDIMSMIEYDLKDIIIFSALIFYIEKNNFKYNETSFKQWMRIVWNITENSYIDEDYSIGLIKLFNELSEHSSDIYKFLADDNNKIKSEISKEAVQYEIRKCKFIIKDNKWEETFIDAEKHPFFKGYIDFLIDDEIDIKKFNHRKKMMYKVFDSNGTKGEFLENHLFLRALISKINYIDYLRMDVTEVGEIFRNIIKSNPCYIYNIKDNIPHLYMHDIIKEWFDSSKDEEELLQLLKNEISSNKSDIYFWGKEDKSEFTKAKTERIKLAHEALYKNNDLQNWIYGVNENNKYKNVTMRVDWRCDNLYLLFPNKRYDRVLIGSYRNKLINYLISNYNCEDRNNYQLPYELQSGDKKKIEYFVCFEITIYYKNYQLNFDRWNQLTIKKENKDFLKEEYRSLNNYTFNDYKNILKIEFFDKHIK